jgi:hypothetical protein
MMKSLTRIVTGKFIIAALALCTVTFVAESCGSSKHACGSKNQKRKRNKRMKRNTTFMTY